MKLNSKMSLLPLACLLAALAGCGGSSYSDNTKPYPPDPPVSMIDAFTKFVTGLLATAPENQEPIAINDVAVTTPEDIEPTPVN